MDTNTIISMTKTAVPKIRNSDARWWISETKEKEAHGVTLLYALCGLHVDLCRLSIEGEV